MCCVLKRASYFLVLRLLCRRLGRFLLVPEILPLGPPDGVAPREVGNATACLGQFRGGDPEEDSEIVGHPEALARKHDNELLVQKLLREGHVVDDVDLRLVDATHDVHRPLGGDDVEAVHGAERGYDDLGVVLCSKKGLRREGRGYVMSVSVILKERRGNEQRGLCSIIQLWPSKPIMIMLWFDSTVLSDSTRVPVCMFHCTERCNLYSHAYIETPLPLPSVR